MSLSLVAFLGIEYEIGVMIVAALASLAVGLSMLAVVYFAWAPYLPGLSPDTTTSIAAEHVDEQTSD